MRVGLARCVCVCVFTLLFDVYTEYKTEHAYVYSAALTPPLEK